MRISDWSSDVCSSDLTPFYDPMIAKLIASAPTRDEAAEILADELDFTAAWPVKTNAGFLVKALRHPRFLSGDVETGFIAATLESLVPEPSPNEGMLKLAALNLGWMVDDANSILTAPPWDDLGGFRPQADPNTSFAPTTNAKNPF